MENTMAISEARELLDGVKESWSPEDESLSSYLRDRTTPEHRDQVIDAFGLIVPVLDETFGLVKVAADAEPKTAEQAAR